MNNREYDFLKWWSERVLSSSCRCGEPRSTLDARAAVAESQTPRCRYASLLHTNGTGATQTPLQISLTLLFAPVRSTLTESDTLSGKKKKGRKKKKTAPARHAIAESEKEREKEKRDVYKRAEKEWSMWL